MYPKCLVEKEESNYDSGFNHVDAMVLASLPITLILFFGSLGIEKSGRTAFVMGVLFSLILMWRFTDYFSSPNFFVFSTIVFTVVWLKPKLIPLALVIPPVLAYGIPVVKDKTTLHGIEDVWGYFIHTRHLYKFGTFLYDPNDAVFLTPDYTHPLFHFEAVSVSRLVGVDPLFIWPLLAFVCAITSTILIYYIARFFIEDKRLAAFSAIISYSLAYRTLTWTHTESMATTLMLMSLYFILKYVFHLKYVGYLVASGISMGASSLTHGVALFYSHAIIGGLIACVFGYNLIKHRRVEYRLILPILVSALIIFPFYIRLVSNVDLSLIKGRSTMIGGNWFPIQCTDRVVCSVLFSAMVSAVLLLFLLYFNVGLRYIILLTCLLSSTLLLYHVVLFRLDLIPYFTTSHRFSSYAFIMYAIACSYTISRFENKFLVGICLFILFSSGMHYAFIYGMRAYFTMPVDGKEYKTYMWLKENAPSDAGLTLTYDLNLMRSIRFYSVSGLEYAVPVTDGVVGGSNWESGYISGTENGPKVYARMREWEELNKSSSEELADFFRKYGITYVVYRGKFRPMEFKALDDIGKLEGETNEHYLFRV